MKCYCLYFKRIFECKINELTANSILIDILRLTLKNINARKAEIIFTHYKFIRNVFLLKLPFHTSLLIYLDISSFWIGICCSAFQIYAMSTLKHSKTCFLPNILDVKDTYLREIDGRVSQFPKYPI